MGNMCMKCFLAPVAVAVTVVPAHGALANEVTLIAPGGIRDAIQKMIPDFERKSGHTVKATPVRWPCSRRERWRSD